ncbi:hypothetical protein E2986_12391 [Frieseomelitta varia]|uniref:Uncharacterized protein n=1 Tax=Frieseomelitta varia TaxID=561572 RepID=A0A833RYC4_9HYME|nr:hypothetical protein E2986_12391 [Frieseomelitta varia]
MKKKIAQYDPVVEIKATVQLRVYIEDLKPSSSIIHLWISWKMIRALISVLLASLSIVSVLPQVMSYAKVSKNGQEEPETRNDQWIVRLDY